MGITFYALDAYAIIGVPKNATTKEIQEMYHRRILAWHPDKYFEKDEKKNISKVVEERFKYIQSAWEMLSDEPIGQNPIYSDFNNTSIPTTEEAQDKYASASREHGGTTSAPQGPQNYMSFEGILRERQKEKDDKKDSWETRSQAGWYKDGTGTDTGKADPRASRAKQSAQESTIASKTASKTALRGVQKQASRLYVSRQRLHWSKPEGARPIPWLEETWSLSGDGLSHNIRYIRIIGRIGKPFAILSSEGEVLEVERFRLVNGERWTRITYPPLYG
ncbi:hypothetical protein N7462_003206 [Penicillium macrosclerotiorum]|uniref:uncharacterized protein n=1 Tax=Penicillium macrosclerotiorum TaxID=303699 RepID=UPI0025472C2A|nr:uncharacterized protein N7462_003206 [Penicillium macrosclerotiorum]KAJ5688814.1 hypothetical protein N7462_003206 [Penicillium macrosclerotiorum]